MPSQILPDHPAKPKVLCLRLALTACCQQGLLHACHGLLRTSLLTRFGAVKELPVGRCQAGQRRGYDPVRRPIQVQHIAQDEHGCTERPVSSQEAQTARPPLCIANRLFILRSVKGALRIVKRAAINAAWCSLLVCRLQLCCSSAALR